MTNPSTPTSSIIHRPLGGLNGYRVVYDRACRAVVHAFPLSDLAAVAAAGLLAGAGAYVLTDGTTAYIGESSRPARRLADHASDPAKGFAREAFVVGGDAGAFDKSVAVDFQYRLTSLAVATGAVALAKGVNPVAPALSPADRSTHDRIFEDALRLLHDSGCPVFRASPPVPVEAVELSPPPTGPSAEAAGDERDGGPLTIDVSTVPLGAAEFCLRYLGIWARGYAHGDRFIVAAGSEVRSQPNGSVDRLTKRRHDQLLGAGVLAAIPGVSDRLRLVVAVAFPTPSIAAKTVCGAHTPGRWLPLDPAKAIWLEA
ncbi:hypothetical protein ABH973_002397 [Bradyrhizobium ottawaense]|uniref:hypothetical protein n=1 Tax=Bradyrhizobium ottawaense TaxID=931866 RepID=UPI001BABC090|nr:hypothetical protein [Bradyrhizobium diazoefficiens]MBR0925198.1 hypothetical protein [Bradyrhizobium diazoefficiens]